VFFQEVREPATRKAQLFTNSFQCMNALAQHQSNQAPIRLLTLLDNSPVATVGMIE
jgi:hypothetical protein